MTALYVRAEDILLEEIRGGVAKMYEADGLGSTRSLLDTTGAQTDTWSYEAFGTTVSSTGLGVNPYRFAGERFVGSVGLYQNRARWLDTRTGRFASVDRSRGDREQPLTLHMYLYGNASPVSFQDASGYMTTMSEVMILTALVAANVVMWWHIPGNIKKMSGEDYFVGPEAMISLPEIRAAYGPPSAPKNFDQGVAALVQFWWARNSHDLASAWAEANNFRNSSLSASQDVRVATADHYLMGLFMYRTSGGAWWEVEGAWWYENVLRLGANFSLKSDKYPSSPWTPRGYDWFRRGREGEGTSEVPYRCWLCGGRNLEGQWGLPPGCSTPTAPTP